MKKQISLLVAAAMLAASVTGCGAATSAAGLGKTGDDKLQIVATIFPEYDWIMNILGENPANAEVTMLLDNGVDLHSYQPTAEDIMKISTCDLFVYVGGESDEWVEDVLKEASNQEMEVIDLLDVLGDAVKEEEMVEGMQESEHEHEHADGESEEHEDADEHDGEDEDEHDHEGEDAQEDHHEDEHEHEDEDGDDHEHEHHHEEGEIEYDEHVWLSLRNAKVLTQAISDALQRIDGEHAQVYEKNTKDYEEKLDALDGEYKEAVSASSANTLLFGDRFPFRYLTDDYGLNYYAAFVGCSAETEASFETVMFLAGKVDELSLGSVLTIEGPDKKIAETIIENTQSKDQTILTMDSMQSVTSKDVEGGADYLSIMEKNLSVLKEALK
ncbi:MAG: metal ABC transporter substrate-binding protein [Lachnospiraceae bacterium]|nr:metal ABC transporter substrate-binding protein [Lachnospiraceae bacterium]